MVEHGIPENDSDRVEDMTAEEFKKLAERLTGTPVKDLSSQDRVALEQILSDNTRSLDRSQLNELLLIVNKDRVQRPFFEHFFGGGCTVERLSNCIAKFQEVAMLRYGNFVFAYRKLSKIREHDEFKKEIGAILEEPEDLRKRFQARQDTLLHIRKIARGDTYLVGYLSSRQIIAENGRAEYLLKLVNRVRSTSGGWSDVIEGAVSAGEEAPSILSMLSRFVKRYGEDLDHLHGFLTASADALRERKARLTKVREDAVVNADIYLTWDHMDVYFATSMRKKSEYEDLHAFVTRLMDDPEIRKLKLRCFDPTQSFTDQRVDKGLVESLMLRRAKCTVYSVQDIDTMGKDSELAATLAQGKPVIAYIPDIDVEERAKVLESLDVGTIRDRLKFVIFSDETFESSNTPDDIEFVRTFDQLVKADELVIWRSIDVDDPVSRIPSEYTSDLERLCRIIAAGERRIYDTRFATLKVKHPLGLQVHLETGVANGLLVARTICDCARLLVAVVTNDLNLEVTEDDRMWYLRERITGSVYRVVTKNRKLTNCFWNYYVP
jgi:hypothetical protein